MESPGMSYILGGNGRYENAGIAIRMARHESIDCLHSRNLYGMNAVDKNYKDAVQKLKYERGPNPTKKSRQLNQGLPPYPSILSEEER